MCRVGRLIILSFFALLSIVAPGITEQADTTAQTWRPSPTGAALRSLVLPGWGQVYVKQPLKAVVYGGAEQALLYAIYRHHTQHRYYQSLDESQYSDYYENERNRLIWYLAGTVILSMLDAYVDAHLYRFDVSDDFAVRQRGVRIFGVGVGFGILTE